MVRLRFILVLLGFLVSLSSSIGFSKEKSELKISTLPSKNIAYEIIAKIKEELKKDPDNLEMINYWAFIADYYGIWEESIKANSRLIELGEVDSAIYNNLGRAYMNLGNLIEAERYLKKSLEIQPDNFFAFHNLGLLLKYKGDLEGSIQYFKRALEISPNWLRTHYHLGNTYLAKKDYDEAIQCYKKAMKFGLNGADVYKNLGLAYIGKDDKREALSYFQKALKFSPEDQELKDLLQMTKEAIKRKERLVISPE